MSLDSLDNEGEILAHAVRRAGRSWRPGRRLAYHAITGGFILGEIVKRVTGKPIRTLLQRGDPARRSASAG